MGIPVGLAGSFAPRVQFLVRSRVMEYLSHLNSFPPGFFGSEPEFTGSSVQLILETPYDKNGRPVPERANIYRASNDRALTFESVVRAKTEAVQEDA